MKRLVVHLCALVILAPLTARGAGDARANKEAPPLRQAADAGEAEARLRLAESHLKAGRVDEAADIHLSHWSANQAPPDESGRRRIDLLCDACRRAARADRLVQRTREALARSPKSAGLWLVLAGALEKAPAAEALEPLEKASALMPADQELGLRLAQALHEAGRWREAADAFQKVSVGRKLAAPQYLAWADALCRAGKAEQSAQVAGRVAFDLGDSVEANRTAARIYREAGRYGNAIYHGQRLLELVKSQPERSEIVAELADLCSRGQQLDEAEKYWRELLRSEVAKFRYQGAAGLVDVLSRRSRLEELARTATAWIADGRVLGDNADSFGVVLIRTFASQRQLGLLTAALEQAVRESPASLAVWRLLADAHAAAGSTAAELAACERAFGLDNGNLSLARRLSRLYVGAARPEKAVELWQGLAVREPGSVAAYEGLSSAQIEADRPEAALQTVALLVKNVPTASAHAAAEAICLRLGQTALALEHARRAAESAAPGERDALRLALAATCVRAGRDEEAATLYESLSRAEAAQCRREARRGFLALAQRVKRADDGQVADSWLRDRRASAEELAEACDMLRRHFEGSSRREAWVRLLSAAAPASACPGVLWRALATAYGSSGRSEEALEALQKAAACLPGDEGAHRELAELSLRLGRKDLAARALERVIRLRPEAAYDYVRLAGVYLDLKRPTDALALAEDAVRRAASPVEGHAAAAQILEKAGDLNRAAQEHLRLIELSRSGEEKALRRLRLAGLYVQLKDWERAESAYNGALSVAVGPETKALAQAGLDEVHASTNRNDEAIQGFIDEVQAQGTVPQQRSSGMKLTRFCRSSNQFERARRLIRERLEKNPKSGALLVLLGDLESAAGDHGAAAGSYQRAMQFYPDDVTLLNQTAAACSRSGETEKQIECLRRLLTLQPGAAAHYWQALALAYAEAGDEKQALASAREYARGAGAEAAAAYHLASTYAQIGRIDLAIPAMEGAIRGMDPPAYTHYYYLATLYMQAGRTVDARAACLRLLDIPDLPQWYEDWAIQQFANGAETPAEAAAVLEEIGRDIRRIEGDPGRPASNAALATRYYVRGRILESVGGADEAIAAHRRAAELAPGEAAYAQSLKRLEMAQAMMRGEAAAVLDDATALWKQRDPFEATRWWVGAKDALLSVDTGSGRKWVWQGLLGHGRFEPLCAAFDPERVWLGTDRGLFVYSRRHEFWRLVPVDGGRPGAAVVAIDLGKDGKVRLTMRADGAKEETVALPVTVAR